MNKVKSSRFSPLIRLVTLVMTWVSLGIVGVWLYARRRELAMVQWSAQWWVFLLLIAMYGISMILSFVVWHSCLRSMMAINWSRDLEFYAYSNLARHLPTGLGHFLVRATRYRAENVEPTVVLYLSAQELLLQIVTGASLSFLASYSIARKSWVIYILAALLLIPVALVIRPSILGHLLSRIRGRGSLPINITRPLALGWLTAYALAWLNGGVMLYILLFSLIGKNVVTLHQTVGLWSFTASLGLLGSVIPLGQFARDATLSYLLQQYMPLAVSVVVAIAFRFILTVGNVVWSLILVGVGKLTHRKYCE